MKIFEKLFPSRVKQLDEWSKTREMGVWQYVMQNFKGWGLLYLLFLVALSSTVTSQSSPLPAWLITLGFILFWSLTMAIFSMINWYVTEREYKDLQELKDKK